jgi:hypothetical protein
VPDIADIGSAATHDPPPELVVRPCVRSRLLRFGSRLSTMRDHETNNKAESPEPAGPPSRDERLAELRTARAVQQHLKTQIQRAALLCGTAVILIGVIAMAAAGLRDFKGRPGEAQTWVFYGILYGLALVAAASLTRALVLVARPDKARTARHTTATATSRLYAFDAAHHYLPTTTTPDRTLGSPNSPPRSPTPSRSAPTSAPPCRCDCPGGMG